MKRLLVKGVKTTETDEAVRIPINSFNDVIIVPFEGVA
jgi:hypothetical protein